MCQIVDRFFGLLIIGTWEGRVGFVSRLSRMFYNHNIEIRVLYLIYRFFFPFFTPCYVTLPIYLYIVVARLSV